MWWVVVGGGPTNYRPYLRVYFSFCLVFPFPVDPELDNKFAYFSIGISAKQNICKSLPKKSKGHIFPDIPLTILINQMKDKSNPYHSKYIKIIF